MMKHLIATLVFVFCVLPPVAQATQTAQVRLYSGSLRFERGYSDSSAILDLSTDEADLRFDEIRSLLDKQAGSLKPDRQDRRPTLTELDNVRMSIRAPRNP